MGMLEKVQETITPLLTAEHMELVDVILTGEGGKRHVRIFLDREEGGIKLDDCATMSHKIGEVLDAGMSELGDYVLEVSSPGIDRVLKTEKDFKRFVGQRVHITLFAPIYGQRNFTGTVLQCHNGVVDVDDVTGKKVAIEINTMARARLAPEL